MSIYPIMGYVNFANFVKVVPARFLHSKVTLSPFIINKHFERGTFKRKYCVSPQTCTHQF